MDFVGACEQLLPCAVFGKLDFGKPTLRFVDGCLWGFKRVSQQEFNQQARIECRRHMLGGTPVEQLQSCVHWAVCRLSQSRDLIRPSARCKSAQGST